MRPPILVGELELASPVPDIELPARNGDAYTAVRLLVRVHREPAGYVLLSPDALDAVSVAERVWQQLGPAINARRGAGWPSRARCLAARWPARRRRHPLGQPGCSAGQRGCLYPGPPGMGRSARCAGSWRPSTRGLRWFWSTTRRVPTRPRTPCWKNRYGRENPLRP